MSYILFSDKFNGELRARKGQHLEATIDFEWLTVKKDGDNIACLCYVNSEPTKALDKDGKVSKFPGLLGFVVSGTSEHDSDKVAHKLLSELEEGKFYLGKLTLGVAPAMAKTFLEKPEMLEAMKPSLIVASPIEERPETAPETLEFPKAWSKGGKQYKSPAERLAERLTMIDALLVDPKTAERMETIEILCGGGFDAYQKLDSLKILIG